MFRAAMFIFIASCTVFAQTSRYALIIGQNDGGSAVNRLQFAERDARRVADVMRGLGDFPKDNISLLLDPDSSDIERYFEKIANNIRSRGEEDKALFMLYYSGHADVNNLLLGSTEFSLEKIQRMISRFPAALRIAVFDACQSGAVAAYKGGMRAEPFYLQNGSALVKGQVIIASASANERAQESQSLKGSVFTFHWINGLNGSADISSDNKVTLNEAYQYAYRKTIESSALATGEIQHPVYRFNFTGQGDIVLTNLNKSEAGIILSKDCEGKFLVLSDDYLEVYGDFFKEKGREIFISLAHGTYTVVNARGKDVGTLIFTLKKKTVFQIHETMFIPNLLTESRIKGRAEADSAMSMRGKSVFSSHKFSTGIGAGFVLYPNVNDDNWDRDISFGLYSGYKISERASVFCDLSGLLFGKTGSVYAGADLIHNNGIADLFIGTGAGMEYAFHKYEKFTDAVAPALTFHGGFIAGLGQRTALQVRIPLTIVFHQTTDMRIGLDLAVCLKIGK